MGKGRIEVFRPGDLYDYWPTGSVYTITDAGALIVSDGRGCTEAHAPGQWLRVIETRSE